MYLVFLLFVSEIIMTQVSYTAGSNNMEFILKVLIWSNCGKKSI